MTLSRSFFGMLLISTAFATACGPAPETTDTTTTAPAALGGDKCDQPNVTYVSRDATECLTINWVCPQGQQQFLNDCGCGCK